MKNQTNRTLRKILSIALCLALVMSYVPMVSITAGAAATDITVTIDTGASVTLRDADGDDYYDIGTADELYAFAAEVDSGKYDINGELTADIVINENLADKVNVAEGGTVSADASVRKWTPMGGAGGCEYKGTFDGDGHTITGLYSVVGESTYGGLIEWLASEGTVKNLKIRDFCLEGNYSGAIAGQNNGKIIGCSISGTGIFDGSPELYVQFGGIVFENLGQVTDCSISANLSLKGAGTFGGIVDSNYGTVTGCSNSGTLTGTKYVGGIVSFNYGIVTGCSNSGTVTGTEYVGGIAGYTDGTVSGCYNTGTVSGDATGDSSYAYVGGIAGYADGTVSGCYNTGIVSGDATGDYSDAYVGGIAGDCCGTVSGCYNIGSIDSVTYSGGIAAIAYDGTYDDCYYLDTCVKSGNSENSSTDGITEKTAEQFASGEVAYLLGAAWGQDLGENGDAYPVLSGKKVYYGYTSCGDTEKKYTNDENTSEEKFAHTGGTATCTTQAVCEVCGESYGELDPNNHEYEKNNGICCDTYQSAILNADNYYEISNAGQLFWFANFINTVDRTANAVLTADIDLEGRPWTPIGSTGENSHNFRGIFDGQNHTVKGLYVEGGRAGLGFFGEVRTGTVKNFTIYGEVVANTDVNYVGGVIGSICGLNGDNDLERNGAIIQNITSYVNLTAKTHGIGMIGGFVGYANHESLIENCSWYGTFDAGEYRVDSGAGGFIGKIQENTSRVTIRNCGAYGTIKTNYAKNSYNNTATIYMGGFLSFSNTDALTTIENCLFAGKFERGENLTDEARLGAFGTLRSVNAIKNCYYLGDDGLEAVHSDSDLKPGENIEITSVTREQLKSGEVAYLLGEAWGQMSNTEGSLPIITDNEIYKVAKVGETGNYSVANVGDTNGDGTVDVEDYQVLVNKALADDHGQIETTSYDDIVKYDIDGNGYLNVIDASIMERVLSGHTVVEVYAVGDYDLNGKAFEEADIKAIKHAIENPEKLATYKKYASDINGDGKVSYDDLNTLTSMFPLYFVGEE